MNQAQLYKTLKEHELWSSSNGKEGKRANLSNVNLSRTSLANANLSGANLSGANLREVKLLGANLSGANLLGANLSRTNLSMANLIRTNLSMANLKGANLLGASLEGATLRGSSLEGAILEHTSIISFTLGKHFAFYHEGYLKIGCKGMSIEKWHNDAYYIANAHKYPADIARKYMFIIKALKEGVL